MPIPLLIGGAISLALEYGPDLARWIAGDSTGDVLQSASEVIKSVTGTADIADAAAVLSSDPAKAAELRLALAKIAADREAAHEANQLETLKAALADTANARAMASQTPLIAKAQIWFAASILAMFLINLILLFVVGVPSGSETILSIVFGALMTAFIGVFTFFFGNSTSGHSANNTISTLLNRQSIPAPTPVLALPAPVVVNQPTGTVNAGSPMPDEAPRTTDALNDASFLKAQAR